MSNENRYRLTFSTTWECRSRLTGQCVIETQADSLEQAVSVACAILEGRTLTPGRILAEFDDEPDEYVLDQSEPTPPHLDEIILPDGRAIANPEVDLC